MIDMNDPLTWATLGTAISTWAVYGLARISRKKVE